jgi:hypothetical protein
VPKSDGAVAIFSQLKTMLLQPLPKLKLEQFSPGKEKLLKSIGT